MNTDDMIATINCPFDKSNTGVEKQMKTNFLKYAFVNYN